MDYSKGQYYEYTGTICSIGNCSAKERGSVLRTCSFDQLTCVLGESICYWQTSVV